MKNTAREGMVGQLRRAIAVRANPTEKTSLSWLMDSPLSVSVCSEPGNLSSWSGLTFALTENPVMSSCVPYMVPASAACLMALGCWRGLPSMATSRSTCQAPPCASEPAVSVLHQERWDTWDPSRDSQMEMMQRVVFPCPVPCHWVHLQSPKNNKSKRQCTHYVCKVQKACFLQISHRKRDINWGITYLSHLSFFCVFMTFRDQRTLHWWALLPSCSKCPLRSAWPCLFFPYMMKRQEWNKVQNALFSLYKIWISWLFSCCLCAMFRVRGPVLTHAFFVRFSPDNIKSCLYQPARRQTLFGGRRR